MPSVNISVYSSHSVKNGMEYCIASTHDIHNVLFVVVLRPSNT